MDVSVSTRSDQSEICAAITEAEHRICQEDVDATVVVTDNPAELDDFNDTPLVVPVPSAPAVNTTQLCELLDRNRSRRAYRNGPYAAYGSTKRYLASAYLP